MSTTRRRATLVAAGILALAGTVAVAPSSSAHACVGVQVNGQTVVGGCHTPPSPGGHVLCPSAGSGTSYVIACTP